MVSTHDVAEIIRAEIAKHVSREFSDTDDFVRDLHLLSDDLTAIALSIERRLGVRLDRREYSKISDLRSYAEVLSKQLSTTGPARS